MCTFYTLICVYYTYIFNVIHQSQAAVTYTEQEQRKFKRKFKSYSKLGNLLNKLDLVDLLLTRNRTTIGSIICDAENNPKNRMFFVFDNNEFIDQVKSMIIKILSGTRYRYTLLCFLKCKISIILLKKMEMV